MVVQVNNIYCVGRNYREHAHELNNAVPTEPMIFAKPTHALAAADGRPVVMPGGRGEIHHEVELVLHIARPYAPELTVDELVDCMALGIDFTLRDVQNELKKKGYPWLLAKGFRNSAVITPWVPFPGEEAVRGSVFSLEKNGVEVQRGTPQDMIFDIPTLLHFIAENFGIGQGDIIFTGTPSGVGPVQDGDRLVMKWQDRVCGEFTVKMSNSGA